MIHILNKLEGMTFTQDEILKVLDFMMSRMNLESKPFSWAHENGLDMIYHPTVEKNICKDIHFSKKRFDSKDCWKCDHCDAIIMRCKT